MCSDTASLESGSRRKQASKTKPPVMTNGSGQEHEAQPDRLKQSGCSVNGECMADNNQNNQQKNNQQGGKNKGQQNAQQDLNQLLKIRREKLAELQAAGADPFRETRYDVTHHSEEIRENFDALEGQEVSIAGRLMSKRVMGKASFCNVQDLKGSIQCYVARDDIGEDSYKGFKKMDIGDIVGVCGRVFKTKTGEISVHAVRQRYPFC